MDGGGSYFGDQNKQALFWKGIENDNFMAAGKRSACSER